jgi:RsmE family RNA methyltransferase
VLVVIGPEGGLAPTEIDTLTPWARLGLGPHVLRAETAALAAATILTRVARSESTRA